MRNNFWNRRIPTLLGLLFIAFAVGGVSWAGKYYSEVRGRASGGETPQNIQISNISNKSFTVIYTTDVKEAGAILYGLDAKLGKVKFDDRDTIVGKQGAYQVHFITLNDLQENTKYYFSIQSGSTNFLNNNSPYEVTTGKALPLPVGTNSIVGSVNLPDGSIPIEGVVIVLGDNMQILSVLLRQDGSYSMSLSSARTQDLSAYFALGSSTILNMSVLSGSARSTVAVLGSEINPVPLVTLGKDYDFTTANLSSLMDHSASASATASSSGEMTQASQSAAPSPSVAFPAFDTTVASGPDILTPKQDQKFTDQQPLFQGTAYPNATVAITIESTLPIKTTVQADDMGNWQYRPADPLDPGNHEITIVVNDLQDIPQTIKRSFTVYAEGSQFIEPSVSPLVSPVASDTATPTVVATPIVIPTNTPTLAPTATPVATATATPNLTLTQEAQLSLTPNPESLTLTAAAQNKGTKISATGSSSLLIGAFVVGLFISAGFVLFFF